MVPRELRIRLEGAVEVLEAAREDFESLEASLPRWEDELPLQRARLEARLGGEGALDEALEKCARVEALGSLVEEVQRRRARVGELARRELLEVAPSDAPGTKLEALGRLRALALALAPVEPAGETPLATLTTTARAPWPLMLLVGVAMAALWWNAAAGVAVLSLALILSSGLRRVTRFELFADRVVVKPSGLRGFSVPLASVTAIGPAEEPVHLKVEGTRRLVFPERESLAFVQRVAVRRLACLSGVRAEPGTGAVMLMTLFGAEPGPGALLIAPSGAIFIGLGAGRAAVETLDGRPVGVDVSAAILAMELSRLDATTLAEVMARLATVPGCLAMPLSSLWCDPPDAQGMVTFHLGAKDGGFWLEPARAKRVEAWLRGG